MAEDRREELAGLTHLLERIGQAPRRDDERVQLGDMLTAVGQGSFGSLLLVPGVITLLPLVGDIPGVPTLMALLVLLVAGQLLLGRRTFWLPQWLLKCSVSRSKLDKAVAWMRKPARAIDRLLKPRLTWLTQRAGTYLVAIFCFLIALAMPLMEVVPFSANGAGLALMMFGLSLMANDGLWALLALILTGGTVGAVIVALL
ncbi:exopolysaccharide biosynthesis protein [Chromohalobacter sp. TMW 2.2308]|uniref:Exopolysaccharide biosynthesis protein n=1 Tax=Chromohalobacter moromii TaxID=2860329 RepID=A0A9X3B355_9GAMM|nr:MULTISPECIES: exopolysaccharide biosynthesis protein [Chromohalobacter]MCK2042696.1 exopolysaccharide biosynthesis protein [Chromohalobacter moromii]MCK2045403.1 exopolysaccharide biosynthesis protein [Chromohalobacter moromii]MCT8504930.1 exopolysaccharide biosynthesis protein [Chromohalobacter moromii]MCT8514784.1 exopolysaccharide biosynthesis protein [Chromohalobacter sp. TMW 2.2271]